MTTAGKNPQKRLVCTHDKAKHEYEILQEVECGVVLSGVDVKAVREGRISLKGSYARIVNGEIFLTGVHIGDYRFADSRFVPWAQKSFRKLLASQQEILRLSHKLKVSRGLTLVPLRGYFLWRWFKIVIGVGQGQKKHDKRARIKDRDMNRLTDRLVKSARS